MGANRSQFSRSDLGRRAPTRGKMGAVPRLNLTRPPLVTSASAACVALACGAQPPPRTESVAPATAQSPAPRPGQIDTPGTRREPGDVRSARSSGPSSRFGSGYPRERVPAPLGRITSLTWGTWVQAKPDARSLPLGSIRPGSGLPLSSEERVPGVGGCREFVAVAGGFVCAGARATLDADSAWANAGRWTEPEPGPFPYEYALSVGAPMLTRVPTKGDRMGTTGKRDLSRMTGWAAGHDELAESAPIVANGDAPDFLRDGGSAPTPWNARPGLLFKRIPLGSMLAYTRAFEADGQTWVLSTNMTVVPASGLKGFRKSSFRGVELSGELRLPIAWARRPLPKWRRTTDTFEALDGEWKTREPVALTGRSERFEGRTLLETRDAGTWIERRGVNVAEGREKGVPWEVQRGMSPNGKWIHIRVSTRTLTLYENARPVFTTLVSPGKQWGTPFGRFFVESKHHVTTMTTEQGEPKKFWVADVPWTLYFERPFAIHGAYWHEDFGEEKSGGCVNLSPIDAERVFGWAEPPLPDGWESAQAYPLGGGTFVLIEK